MARSRRLSKTKSGTAAAERGFPHHSGARGGCRGTVPPDILLVRNTAVRFRPQAEKGDAAVRDAATRPAGMPKDHAV